MDRSNLRPKATELLSSDEEKEIATKKRSRCVTPKHVSKERLWNMDDEEEDSIAEEPTGRRLKRVCRPSKGAESEDDNDVDNDDSSFVKEPTGRRWKGPTRDCKSSKACLKEAESEDDGAEVERPHQGVRI